VFDSWKFVFLLHEIDRQSMLQMTIHRDFEVWRTAARRLLAGNIPPEQVLWSDDDQPALLASDQKIEAASSPAVSVSRSFIHSARLAACHRDPQRWSLLYRLLWRLTHGQPDLLERITDDDVHLLHQMEKAVSRDRHKMTAFVRFRRTDENGTEHFIAWHRPDHFIVKLTAPFFAERFAALRWTILTPDDSVSWDGHSLCFSPAVPMTAAPQADDLEELWKTYYANIFNPARIKLNAMRKEMPVRHWATLPETQLIPDLLRDAPRRVEEMVNKAKAINCPPKSNPAASPATDTATSAADFLPSRLELPQLITAAGKCRGCSIYCNATQTVFGEGPATAKLIIVGEQPGDQEDLAGRPFVGPAGKLLDRIMDQVGLPRDEIYVTNAVKHFKWEPRGTRRIHSKPSSREVAACKPWLEAEIAAIRPGMIVALGATAAQSLFGNGFRVTQHRGQKITSPHAQWCMATIHPSALLRTPDDQRDEAIAEFARDLKKVALHLKSLISKN
jgi:uracil-DNA glycosylase